MALKNYDPHLYDLPKYKKMVHYIPISLKSKTLQIIEFGENSNRTQILEIFDTIPIQLCHPFETK